MAEQSAAAHHPDDKPAVPPSASDASSIREGAWRGPTYYGRSQLKAAPFNNWVVGGYVFLAGLSGASALLSTVADVARGPEMAGTVRRGRYLSLLAPSIGSMLLVYDLHTPKRFYNMLRVAKHTSPMSIGTWILMSFSGLAFTNAATQWLSDHVPGLGWLRGKTRMLQIPAAFAGAGLSTYTAALLSATSTPLWAAAPQSLAVRFGSSSIVAGASALSLGEENGHIRRSLDLVAVGALAADLAATLASHRTYRRKGVEEALQGRWGLVEKIGVTIVGMALPLGLHSLSLVTGRRPGRLSRVASVAALAGSALLRVSVMGAGDVSASRPDISFRFAQPENLPHRR